MLARHSPKHEVCRSLCVDTYYASLDATKHGHEVVLPEELEAARCTSPFFAGGELPRRSGLSFRPILSQMLLNSF